VTAVSPASTQPTGTPWYASDAAARLWYAVLAAGLAWGAASFGYQWWQGLTVTGLTNTVTWGLYIVTFMFLVGVSAGGLIVVAGSELVGSERLAPLSRLAVIVSGTAILAAGLSILPDLGRPEMVWNMLVQPNWTSPLVWDMVVITVYLTIAAVDLWILTRPRPMHRALRIMAIISLPVAVLVHSVTAWIFGLLVARPFWNTALLAPMFITSALVSGTALILLIAWTAARTTRWEPPGSIFRDLGWLRAWFIATDAFLLAAEVLTVYTSRVPYHTEPLAILLTGELALLFWSEVGLGLVVPFVVFASARLRTRAVWFVPAALLAVLGVFAKRINILIPGMYEPLVGMAPGIPAGRPGQPFEPAASYVPTWVEWGVLAGILAFAAAVITVGVRYLVVPEQARGRRVPWEAS
jgi:dimethyl sulfoxide reductase membrane subunit